MTKKKEKLKEQLTQLLEEKKRRLKYNYRDQFFPDKGKYRRELYKKHIEFMAKGRTHSERAFIAANRSGKTLSAAFELSCHLTGDYPEWWQGRRFDKPVDVWVAGITNESTRDVVQVELLGKIGEIGTGMIPKDSIGKVSGRPGIQNAIGFAQVKHSSGGWSNLSFKSYVQGWETFQGTKKDIIWLDEEPTDHRIYTECLTRTAGDDGKEGMIYCTFTPLAGFSDIVLSFLPGGTLPPKGEHPEQPHKYVTTVTWDDVPHLSETWKKQALASFPPHLRDAKSKGMPSMGVGAIYPVPEEQVKVEPFDIPPYWPRAFGMDFGWHKTAVVWAAQDPDSRIIYIYSEHYLGHQTPPVHAGAISKRGAWIWGVGDPAGGGSSQRDGTTLFNEYQELGINVRPAIGGPNSKEPKIARVLTGLENGTIKVFSTCVHWFEEFRIYRRTEKNGQMAIVKERDHLMDATQYLMAHFDEIAINMPDEDDISHVDSDVHGRNEITGY